MKQKGPWYTSPSPTKYQFGDKEFNDDFGLDWSDFGHRWYDATVARWWSVDKLADHPNQVDKSPYAYAWNNPITYNDPDGNCPWCVIIAEAVLDIGFTVYDAAKIGVQYAATGTVNPVDVAALGADAAAIVTPGMTGAGMGVRATAEVGQQIVKYGDDIVDGAKAGGKKVVEGRHNANVRITDKDGKTVKSDRLVSGNMTPEEKALGFPKNTLETHTEARAMKDATNKQLLKDGNNMTITGQKAPCPSCKGKMNKTAKKTGANIKYQWRENGKTNNWQAKKE